MKFNRNFLYHNSGPSARKKSPVSRNLIEEPHERRKKTRKSPFQKKSPVNNTIKMTAEEFKRLLGENPGLRVSGIPENETNRQNFRVERKSDGGSN